MTDQKKYEEGVLPGTPDEAIAMAEVRESWAVEARAADKHGSAKEWEMTAKLLRWYACTTGVKGAGGAQELIDSNTSGGGKVGKLIISDADLYFDDEGDLRVREP